MQKRHALSFPLVAGTMCSVFFLHAQSAAFAAPAAPETPNAEETQTRLSWSPQPYKTTTALIAERIKARADFAASAVQRLGTFPKGAGKPGEAYLAEDFVVDGLWLLRSAPKQQLRWFKKFAAAETNQDKRRVFRDFAGFMRLTEILGCRMLDAAPQEELAKRRAELQTALKNDANRDYSQYEMTLGLDITALREEAFAAGLLVREICAREDVRLRDVDPHIETLRELRGDREKLRLAVLAIKRDALRNAPPSALPEKIATMARSKNDGKPDEAERLLARYEFAMRLERGGDCIGLPLSRILPDTAKTVERNGVTALNAAGEVKTQHSLSERLPEDLAIETAAARSGKSRTFSFLNPGERLYALHPSSGAPVFHNTPLAKLADSGPRLMEFSAKTAEEFSRLFADGNPSRAWDRPYLIAAVCGPEELAAHLASIAIVRSQRERSLYGPFADFAWPEAKNAEVSAALPKDAPGDILRFAELGDADLFLTLAPLADEAGLYRLMGPIRGVWAKEPAEGRHVWRELRFAPPRPAKAVAGKLDSSPILALDKTALQALVRAKENLLAHEWASFFVRETGGDSQSVSLRGERFPEALKRVQKTFGAMRVQGVVSPWDKGAMLYLLEAHARDAVLLQRLSAVLNDTRLSSAKRVRTMNEFAAK